MLRTLRQWIAERRAKREAARTEAVAAFHRRLLQPDFAALEHHFGCRPGELVLRLYSNREELVRDCVTRRPYPDAPEDQDLFVAYYLPADSQALAERWPANLDFLEFADDGLGNRLVIDPRVPDPEILFYDHEENSHKPTGCTLSRYLNTQPEPESGA